MRAEGRRGAQRGLIGTMNVGQKTGETDGYGTGRSRDGSEREPGCWRFSVVSNYTLAVSDCSVCLSYLECDLWCTHTLLCDVQGKMSRGDG